MVARQSGSGFAAPVQDQLGKGSLGHEKAHHDLTGYKGEAVVQQRCMLAMTTCEVAWTDVAVMFWHDQRVPGKSNEPLSIKASQGS